MIESELKNTTESFVRTYKVLTYSFCFGFMIHANKVPRMVHRMIRFNVHSYSGATQTACHLWQYKGQ